LKHHGFRPAPHNIDGSDGFIETTTPEDGIYFNFCRTDDAIRLIDAMLSSDPEAVVACRLRNRRVTPRQRAY
jgi:hypothetical protein